MRCRTITAATLLVGWMWMLTACGDESSSSSTVILGLTVLSFEPGQEQAPVSGAEVCVLGTDDCDTSDGTGQVFLPIPANAESAVTITADGFNPTVSPQIAEEVDLVGREATVISTTTARALATVLDLEYPLTDTGVIAITVLTDPVDDPDNGIPGITFTLTEPAGRRYYLDENGIPQTEIDATTAPLGTGGFIEVSTGTYEIELGGTASNCEPLAGWVGSVANSVRVPVEAGFFTDTYVVCDPS